MEDESFYGHLIHAGDGVHSAEPAKGPMSFFETTEWAIITGVILGILFVGVLDIVLEWRSGYDVLLLLALSSIAWWVVFGRMITLIVDQIDTGSIYDGAVRTFHSVVFRGLCIVTITYFGRLARLASDASSMSPPDIIMAVLVTGILLTDVYFSLQRASRIAKEAKRQAADALK